MIDNIESKIENRQLQECCLKIGPFGTYIEDLIFLENKIV